MKKIIDLKDDNSIKRTTSNKSINETRCTCKLSKTLIYLRSINKLYDVCFLIEKYQFYCHKLAVITHCPQFRLHILNTRPKDLVEIKLCYSTKRGISTIIQYIYAIEINIDIYNFADTLVTSYELGIEKLIEKCENFINENVEVILVKSDAEYEIEIKKLVISLSILFPLKEKEFFRKIMSHVAKNFDYVIETDEFLDLDVKLLYDLLKYYPISISKEIELFNGIVKWLKKDSAARYKYEKLLLDLIRFQHISPQDIENHVEAEEFVMNDPDIQEKIKTSLKVHALKQVDKSDWIKNIKLEKARDYTFEKYKRNSPEKKSNKYFKNKTKNDMVENLDEDVTDTPKNRVYIKDKKKFSQNKSYVETVSDNENLDMVKEPKSIKTENQRIIKDEDDISYENIEPEKQFKVKSSSNINYKVFSSSSLPFIDDNENLKSDCDEYLIEKESMSNTIIIDCNNNNFELPRDANNESKHHSKVNTSATHSQICSFNDESFEFIDIDEIRDDEKKVDASTSFTLITRLVSNKNDVDKNNNTTDLSLTSYIMKASTNKSCENSLNELDDEKCERIPIKDDNTIASDDSILNQDAEDTNNNNNTVECDEINKNKNSLIEIEGRNLNKASEDKKELKEIQESINNKVNLIEKSSEKVINELSIIQKDIEKIKSLNSFDKLYSFEKTDQNTNKTIIEIQIIGSNYISKVRTFNDVIVMNYNDQKVNVSENVTEPVNTDGQERKIEECDNISNINKICQNDNIETELKNETKSKERINNLTENFNNEHESSCTIHSNKEDSEKYQNYKEYDNNDSFSETDQENVTNAENEIHLKDDTYNYADNIYSNEDVEIESLDKIGKNQDHRSIKIVNDCLFEASSTTSLNSKNNSNFISNPRHIQSVLEKFEEEICLNNIDLITNEDVNKKITLNNLVDENMSDLSGLLNNPEQVEEIKGISVKSTIKSLEDLNWNNKKELTEFEKKFEDIKIKKKTNLNVKTKPVALEPVQFKIGSVKMKHEFKKFENDKTRLNYKRDDDCHKSYEKPVKKIENDYKQDFDANNKFENTLNFNKRVSEAINLFEGNRESGNHKFNYKTYEDKTNVDNLADNLIHNEIANEFELNSDKLLENDLNSKKGFKLSNLFKICKHYRKKE